MLLYFNCHNLLSDHLCRCLFLCVVLRAPLAAGRPDAQESLSAALIVYRVLMERSATTLVGCICIVYSYIVFYNFCMKQIVIKTKEMLHKY